MRKSPPTIAFISAPTVKSVLLTAPLLRHFSSLAARRKTAMGKISKKCGDNGELAARCSGLAVVFGPRSRERRRAAVTKRERRIFYREHRKRGVGIQTPTYGTVPGNLGGVRYKSSPELGRIPRCSSDTSSEASTTPSRSSEVKLSSEFGIRCFQRAKILIPYLFSQLRRQRRDAALLFRWNGEREEPMTSINDNRRDEASDVESTVEMEPYRRPSVAATPPEAELEAFFATAERNLQQRFAERYNFDVVNDVPMGGRYEWIPVIP
ncbi:hypothetical protein ZIOFF_039347 [Zingiber officinale]|uniref:Cyclin-dependent kinase inhibitor domain-containing protein n=1 Tax=Zingiber officinale TaxID=94328 RepID=A0A8J5L041_ZINOF|nr:hypothetical protein ZIOFF_039347 [Zingiber officinale]